MTMTDVAPRVDHELLTRGESLRARMFGLALDAKDERLRVVAVGLAAIQQQRARILAMSRASVTRMQTGWSLPPLTSGSERRVLYAVLVPSMALTRCPLLACEGTGVRVAPVSFDMTLVDDHVAMLPGPATAQGEPALYATTNPEVIAPLRALRDELLAASAPAIEAATEPPTARQLEVARSLARGDKDTTTARRLGMSVRTIEREVSAILGLIGARNRHEAGLILNGAAV